MIAALGGWTVEAMIASALLMVVVLLVRAPVRHAFGPRIAYALWALPLLRLVLPPLPAAWHAPAAEPIAHAGEVLVLVVQPAGAGADGGAAIGLGATLAVLWLIGAAGFVGWHGARHHVFCRRIMRAAVSVERVGRTRIVVSRAAPGPLAFGVWRRTVALPADFAERYDDVERGLAVAHELSHHEHGDLLANWAALAVLALHWFDPVAWYAFRAFRADQELANDARTLAGRPAADRHAYARALVKAAQGGALSPACHLRTVADLKGRLTMLATSPASRRRLASGAAAVGALLVAGLGLTASGTSAAAISASVQQAVAPPAPPVPDVSPAPDATAAAHQVKRVVVTKNGKTTSYASADVDAHLAAGERVAIRPLAPDSSRMIIKADGDPDTRIEVQDIPAIKSATCGIGTGKPASMLVHNGRGNKRLIVICTDRIRRATADAMVTATSPRDIERTAYAHALAGLLDARTKAVADAGLNDADRARALGAIDTSIIEMRGQLARFD
jgi:beta-lactamase regulating signal transducer with metallopeptidase domain